MAASEAEAQLILHNRILEELGAKHREFETLAELLEEIVFRCDGAGHLTLLNVAWEHITGWEVQESLGKRLSDFLVDGNIAGELSNSFSISDSISLELPIRAITGQVKTFKLKARKKNDTWYGSLHDITDLNATLFALQNSQAQERKLSLVASNTDNLVIITDAKGSIEWVNSAFTATTGYAIEEVLGRSPGNFLQGPETSQETISLMREHLRKGTPFNVEVQNYSRDGASYWLDIDCFPIFDDKGDISNFIAIERVITQQKEAEEALRESEQHYRSILDTVSEAIFYCNADFKLLYTNPAWETITGHKLAEDKDAYLSQFVHPEDLALLFNFSTNTEKLNRVFKQELRLRHKFGNWRRVEIQLSNNRLRSSGELQLTGAVVDIEERWQETQAIIGAMKEAEALSQARTRFIANMSHEIRTPLNAIIGMSTVLQQTRLDADQKVCVDTLKNGGKALLALVNDVLDLSKLDSTEIELESSRFDLAKICEEAVDIVSATVEEKHLQLSMACSEGVPPTLIGDAHRVRQLLLNLMSNAIKFTHKGGISLHLSWNKSGYNTGILTIQVEDSGIGIPPDRLNSLFNAFVQADPSTTRQYGGTGLGLAICQQICSAMGGEIYARSTVGEGSTFTCHLPLEYEPTPATRTDISLHAVNLDQRHRETLASLEHCLGLHCSYEEIAEAPSVITVSEHGKDTHQVVIDQSAPILTPNRLWSTLQRTDDAADMRENADSPEPKRLRILIAEDALPNQLVISAMLKQLGYTDVTIVENGKLAVEHCQHHDYDIALLDIHMPVMDGVAAATAIAPLRKGGTPVLVAASADVTNESRQAVSSAGFNEWLDKPFTREALASLLARVEQLLTQPPPPESLH
ncbi:PAS domain S-box protein [Spongiibacter sp. KMU-166]|uniref:histidine kinase n=1 Tax=Spongiibacter thalassae TaxID=2721624 RepID=A0ABX1GJE3_9GAMM|nr:PAS domain-containing hybrid sensor histidine kinase/response regulator [Spongiibacter thalassae]NKI19354.1 PAS domain S-box protein [Spongiibacter thalassae]